MEPRTDRHFPQLYFKFRELDVVETPGHANRTDHISWLPPECPAGFRVTQDHPWHILDQLSQQRVQPAMDRFGHMCYDRPDHVRHYDTTSMFYTTELNSWFEVPYDCTVEHVSQRRRRWDADGWSRISFDQSEKEEISGEYPNLWRIGHGHRRNQIDSRFNITDTWDNLLLPGSFVNGVQNKNTLPTCALAGRLTILLGLVAFAAHRNDLLNMINLSFRPGDTAFYVPVWMHNSLTDQGRKDQGIINKRGLIIDIGVDLSVCNINQIEAWQDGYRGPILECLMSK